MLIKIILWAFAAFAVLSVWRRARLGEINRLGAIVWTSFWAVVAAAVLWPDATSVLANLVGVGRGTDLLLYVSVATLFYAVFRLASSQRRANAQMTRLVRELALRDLDGKADDGR